MTSTVTKTSAATAGRSLIHRAMMVLRYGGVAPLSSYGFEIYFARPRLGPAVSLTAGLARRLGYFCGTWSMCGQTAAIRASFSGPAAFFGVSERQPAFSSMGLDGV